VRIYPVPLPAECTSLHKSIIESRGNAI
jgi:hypothetical protein